MTICLITSFAPVRVGSAICLEPLPVGRWTPFHRSLSVVGSRARATKKPVSRAVLFPAFDHDTRVFTVPPTDVAIRPAQAGDKPTKLTDSNGLYIEIRPCGSKLWRYRYRIVGEEIVSALGEYPGVSPQEARKARGNP
ncbi:Arm DNA-binding domain-containing protein [Burkholderia vietnamiensis]|uniref:Arm DNA-binding domain-containing protein n=1 Tax=Burkholderia vietnamiensis TaxID=60552 RepID=UPI001E5C0A0D|nr:Arm DNA-binding domain-containing protein [Burkholderia vietnamiensis]